MIFKLFHKVADDLKNGANSGILLIFSSGTIQKHAWMKNFSEQSCLVKSFVIVYVFKYLQRFGFKILLPQTSLSLVNCLIRLSQVKSGIQFLGTCIRWELLHSHPALIRTCCLWWLINAIVWLDLCLLRCGYNNCINYYLI